MAHEKATPPTECILPAARLTLSSYIHAFFTPIAVRLISRAPAVGDSFRKLDPRLMIRNPVLFVTQIGVILTTVSILTSHDDRSFVLQFAIWLWFTVLFANFAEAIAEGRGKAQADSLRKARSDTMARRLKGGKEEQPAGADA